MPVTKQNKVSKRIETIFSQAMALTQAGRLKNTIYVEGKNIFILNSDNTVLLRFQLRESETAFHAPIAFAANDYDSNQFYEEGGRIVFVTQNGDYERKKTCKTPGMSPGEVEKLFDSYEEVDGEEIEIGSDLLPLLDSDLSHIEFSVEDGNLFIRHRNIYSGTILEIGVRGEGKIERTGIYGKFRWRC